MVIRVAWLVKNAVGDTEKTVPSNRGEEEIFGISFEAQKAPNSHKPMRNEGSGPAGSQSWNVGVSSATHIVKYGGTGGLMAYGEKSNTALSFVAFRSGKNKNKIQRRRNLRHK